MTSVDAGGRARGGELARVPGAFGEVNVGVQSAAFRLRAHERDAARRGGVGSAPAPEIGLMIATIDMRVNFEAVTAREPCYSNVQHRRLEDA